MLKITRIKHFKVKYFNFLSFIFILRINISITQSFSNNEWQKVIVDKDISGFPFENQGPMTKFQCAFLCNRDIICFRWCIIDNECYTGFLIVSPAYETSAKDVVTCYIRKRRDIAYNSNTDWSGAGYGKSNFVDGIRLSSEDYTMTIKKPLQSSWVMIELNKTAEIKSVSVYTSNIAFCKDISVYVGSTKDTSNFLSTYVKIGSYTGSCTGIILFKIELIVPIIGKYVVIFQPEYNEALLLYQVEVDGFYL